ncbi:sigma factor-like helix-turn-helix DNA-binding protein [Saccharothrix sp. Mg75]|uniref:sigma factor-like helix-turn-helix DNA-binding protein n=1 Tax=Saccharothrix sp. Mg75 TaxID=3445357 RepID=UPI003EEB210D
MTRWRWWPVTRGLLDADDDDESAARARADAELCDLLRRQGFQGPAWDGFVDELMAYGVDRVRMLIATGYVVSDRTATRPAYLDALRRRPSDVDELVDDVVLAGFALFVDKGLVGGGWEPGRASLTTYFIGACRLVFPSALRTWLRRGARHSAEVPVEDVAVVPVPGWHEETDHVQRVVDRLAEVLSPLEMRLFGLVGEGYDQAEIADITSMTVRAVEGRLRRARAKARDIFPQWGEEGR